MFPTTKTELAKKAIHMIVALQVESATEKLVVEYTDHTEDDILVKVGSMCIGHLAAQQTDPLTDRAVDAVVNKFKSWRESKKTVAQD